MAVVKSLGRKFWIFIGVVVFYTVELLADGLPGEYILTHRWRNMITDRSPVTNPALMTEENYISLRAAFAPVLGGEFNLIDVGITLPIGLYQSVGVEVLGELDGPAQEGTFREGNLVLDENSYQNVNLMALVGYGIHIWNKLSIGASVKTAIQTLYSYSDLTLTLDAGLSYRLLRHPVFGDHVIGLSTQNLLTLKNFSESGEAFSKNLKLSWLGNFWERRIEGNIDFDIKDFFAEASAFSINNINNPPQLEWDINMKAGVWLLRILKVYLQLGMDQDIIDYYGIALGFNIPTINNGRDLEFFTQYNIMTEERSEASAFTFSLRTDLGKHREEVYARRMARLASLSPNELYNLARRLYSEKKYWDAFFVFSRIIVEFPDFFKNDWVKYYRASCQEELDMRDVAIANYENTIKEYPLSGAVPYAHLGLMRVHYRNGDFARVANEFVELSKPDVPDSLRYHAAYLMGQTYLQSNDPLKAIQVFGTIPEGHPDYIFAQHAMAVAHVIAGSDMSQVVAALENCVSAKATTPEEKEMVNRSYLFLGYIFYEENALSKAIVALRMVPTTSYYAEDALLGQGWTALKARQWNDCISVGTLLSKTTEKPVLKCEGMLIRAYGHLLQKDYGQALSVLKNAYDMIKPLSMLTDDTLNYEKMQYESERMAYNFVAEKVENISKAGQTAAVAATIDSLHMEQIKYVEKFKAFYKFADEFKRSSFFMRNVDVYKRQVCSCNCPENCWSCRSPEDTKEG
ncbi:MAG: tetratricopeptide repeat protein [Chitinispirillaceae bacterium]|nr:tetratricopeptide repeat protein [Chitinispirillaceae bacterium]